MEGHFQLGPWLVRPNLNSASRNGTSKRLTPKAMEVLVCLAQHAGEPVPKEKLIERVWPETYVGDDALKGLVAEIRRALEDDAKQPSIIETIAKRGYRLIAPIEWVDGKPGASAEQIQPETVRGSLATKRKSRLAGWVILASVLFFLLLGALNVARVQNWLRPKGSAQIHSIAVLPLRNLSNDPTQEYFSDGMTDSLITDLAQISSLKVISHTSIIQYKDTKKLLPDIARELNVDGIIEGTIQRSGDNVRINVQLIYGPADRHIWARSYERAIRDVFGLEREVTEDISRRVQARLTANQAPPAEPRPINPKALDAYLEGNYHMQRVAHGSVDEELNQAAASFRQAINIDPNFAPAYLGLSDALGSRMGNIDEPLEDGTLEKALQLDPSSSEVWSHVGDYKLFGVLDWSGAEKAYRQAILLNPNNVDAHDGLSHYLVAMGRLDEAWSESQIAQELDPNQDHLCGALLARREYDRAIEILLKWIERHPDDGEAYGGLSAAYSRKGMQKEAIEALDRMVTLYGFPEASKHIRQTFAASGFKAAKRQFALELENLAATKRAYLPASTACVYAEIGDKERAFYWLDQAYQHREAVGRESGLVFIKVDPSLDSLRSDPRFTDLLRRVGLPQ